MNSPEVEPVRTRRPSGVHYEMVWCEMDAGMGVRGGKWKNLDDVYGTSNFVRGGVHELGA